MGGPAQASGFATGALLGIVEQSGAGIATLTEGLEREELQRSRLTRAEVQRLLLAMADSLGALDPGVRAAMPELDWDGWAALAPALRGPAGEALDDALAFGHASLVPATLLWLRVYRQSHPERFRMAP